MRYNSRGADAPPSLLLSRRRRKRSGYNVPGTSAWSRSSRLRPLSPSGCFRVTLRDVITAVAGGRRISAPASSSTTTGVLCSLCSTRASARISLGDPGATFIQCMHVARARRNMRTALTASAGAAAGGPLERWNCSARCCGGRLCCRRCCCCCCGCCRAAAAVPRSRGWTTVKPLSDPPSGLGRRGSSTMSCGGGGVAERSSSRLSLAGGCWRILQAFRGGVPYGSAIVEGRGCPGALHCSCRLGCWR